MIEILFDQKKVGKRHLFTHLCCEGTLYHQSSTKLQTSVAELSLYVWFQISFLRKHKGGKETRDETSALFHNRLNYIYPEQHTVHYL